MAWPLRRWRPAALLASTLVVELTLATAVLAAPRNHPASAPVAGTARTLLVAGDRTVRLVSLGGSNTDRLLNRVAADIGAALDAVQAFWGAQWTREITIVATGSEQQFVAAAGGGTASQWADIAAVTVADHVDPDHRVAAGQRIVFAPGAVAMSDAALRIVLRHELFHYATRADTALDAPRWLTEGAADFVGRPPTSAAGAAALATTLPSDADLDVPGAQRSLAYDKAWWFIRFVADAYGTATLRQLYVAACGAGHTDAVAAMRIVLRGDPASLLERWRRWLTG